MQTTGETSGAKRQGRFFYGWWVVAVSSLQGMFGSGAISSGFPIFFEPIRRDLGISYTSMSLIFSLARAEGGMGSPLVGWMVDKFGSRPMILFGGLIAGIGLILMSRADSYWHLVLIFVGVVSTGKTAGLGQTLMAKVNQWFVRRKAIAMSTLMTAFAGGGAIVVPLLHFGIANIGWRDTLLYTGIFVCLLILPMALILRSKPEDLGLLPDGDVSPAEAASGSGLSRARARMGTQEFTVRQALRTHTFWFMLAGVVARVSATNAIIIHIVPLLEGEGLTTQTVAVYVSVMFFLAIPLRFVMGMAGGRVSYRKLLFVGLNLGAVGLLALLLMDGTAGVVVFILTLAVVEGVSGVNWIMLGDYCGRGRFASLMGVMSVFHNVGMFVSPIFSGWIKDRTGSYDLVLITFVPLYILSGCLFALAGRPAPPGVAAPATEQAVATR